MVTAILIYVVLIVKFHDATNVLPSLLGFNETSTIESLYTKQSTQTTTSAVDESAERRRQQQPRHDLESSIPTFPRTTATVHPRDAFNLSYRVSFEEAYPHPDAVVAIQPLFGTHRSDQDAIFSFARGYQLPDYMLFISSLIQSDFTGDLVLGVSSDLSTTLREYFEYYATHHHVIVYAIPLDCISVNTIRTHCQTVGFFAATSTTNKTTIVDDGDDGRHHHRDGTTSPEQFVLKDSRPHREVAQLRFEYYWAWSTLYSTTSRLWLLDSRDVYFQRHPLTGLQQNDTTTTLHVYAESNRQVLWQQRSNRRWIKKAYGEEWFKTLKYKTVICSGSTFGGQPAIRTYTSAMVHQFDVTNCTVYGCDQGHHNFLISANQLVGGPNITSVRIYEQGHGTVNTLGLLMTEDANLTSLGILKEDGLVYNTDGTVSPIIHQFDRDPDLVKIMELRKNKLLQEWNERRKELTK
jgi:hypothetical protein